jgi:hypothetical protein
LRIEITYVVRRTGEAATHVVPVGAAG